MKKIVWLLLLFPSLAASTTTYESLDISFDQFMTLANLGDKSPQVKHIVNRLSQYDEFINGQLKSDFTDLLTLADEQGYRVFDRENIPSLVTVVSGCIHHAVEELNALNTKYLDSADHIHGYALVMSCVGFIDRLEEELSNMRSMNWDFIKANGYKDKTFSMWAKTTDTNRMLIEETSLYFRHLLPETEAE